MLIGEVVPLAYSYLRDNPMVEERDRYADVVVDEYQDLNVLEQRLLDLLAENGNLCIAGDDDQSIYGFRYANPEGILAFLEREDVEKIAISVCGRCPRTVLAMANELISHAPDRAKDALEALQEVDGDIAIVQWASLDEEVDGLTAAIAGSVERGDRAPGDILVLVHRQHVGESIRDRLNALGVPAHSFFAQESVTTDEAREALARLRIAASAVRIAWRVILGLGAADGRRDAYARLASVAKDSGLSEVEVLEQLAAGAKFDLNVPAFLSRYRAAIARLQSLTVEDLTAVVDALLPEGVEAVTALRAIALEEIPAAETLVQLVDAIVVRVTQHAVPENPNFVRIMSLLNSKGLTSPVVHQACMVDGVVPTIPSRLAPHEAEAAVCEQRRLVYVALTRASVELVISSSVQMSLGVAMGMGVNVARDRIRNEGGEFVAPTIASPNQRELAA